MKPRPCKRRRPEQESCRDGRPRFLLPRVLDAQREAIRCLPACLAVSGLPCGLPGPFTLLSVEAACEEVRLVPCPWEGCACRAAEAVIPLAAWVEDGCGGRHCGQSEVRVRVRLPENGCAPCGGSVVAAASARLAGACRAACEPVFDARLEVCVDIYLVRMEPCGRREAPCPPACPPPPPMYPQPRPAPPPFPEPGPFIPWR